MVGLRLPTLPRVGLLGRLAIALALVGLLPVAFTTQRLIGLNEEGMALQVEQVHAVAARTTAERIGAFLDSRRSLAQGLAEDPALNDPRSAAARAVLGRDLDAWQGLGVEGILVVDRAGVEAIRAQLADPVIKERLDAAVQPPPGAAVVLLADREPALLRLEVELPGGQGLVWLVCNGREVGDALRNYELGDETEVLLIDDQRRVLIGAAETLAQFPDEVVALALEPRLSGTKPSFRAGADEREFIGGYAAVPQAGWAVLSRQPIEVARRVAIRMRRSSNVAVAGALGLIALLSAVAYATVVRPIRQLAHAQRRLAGVPVRDRGGTEIDQLKAAFDALAQRLGDQERLDEVFLGRYQVNEVVGSGAMGTVFRGWDPKLRRPVALKTVRLDRKVGRAQRQELMERLVSEAVTVARFNHPNIVGVFDVEDHPEGAFVAMEFVDGVSLEHLIWQVKRIEPGRVAVLGAHVARALEIAHRAGVVHRDIKPANILLGSDGSIKVTDFGISEMISALAPDTDVVFGTPGFVPPETLTGKGYDASGDLFSLGAVLYTSLVGVPPFEGRTVKEVVRKTLFGVVERPAQRVPGVPPELDRCVMSLLARERAKRPSDAATVAETLERLVREHGYAWSAPVAEDETVEEAGPSHLLTQWLPTTRLRER